VSDWHVNRLRNLVYSAVCEARAFGVSEDQIRGIVRDILPDSPKRPVEIRTWVDDSNGTWRTSGRNDMTEKPKRRGRPPKNVRSSDQTVTPAQEGAEQ
jgi:hypothetical protein